MSRILGIETSCDETGVAIVESEIADLRFEIMAAEVASQIAIHAPFGGVVPEIASRQHIQCISQLAGQVIAKAGNGIDAVAATIGPGLMGSLLVGVNFAKALAYKWRVPFIPVHHIEGHIFSVFLAENQVSLRGVPDEAIPPDNEPSLRGVSDEAILPVSQCEYPFLSLVVSGGHTCLIDCPQPHEYHMLGTTRDDAVGESFDKVARLLGLPYPGGPSIQKAAEQGNPKAIRFPRGLARSGTLEFSYSGLKTAVLYELRKNAASQADMAASFQWAAVDVLIAKTKLALDRTGATRLVLAGGVAANKLLRHRLTTELDVPVFLPPLALCLDNGAMIACAGASRLEHGLIGDLRATPRPNLPLAS